MGLVKRFQLCFLAALLLSTVAAHPDDEEEERNEPAARTGKLVVMAGFVVVTLLFGLMPMYFYRYLSNQTALDIVNAFSGGVFLCAGLAHILPEALEAYEETDLHKRTHYPVPYIMVLLGYMTILFVERVAFAGQSLHHGHAHGHGHGHGHGLSRSRRASSVSINGPKPQPTAGLATYQAEEQAARANPISIPVGLPSYNSVGGEDEGDEDEEGISEEGLILTPALFGGLIVRDECEPAALRSQITYRLGREDRDSPRLRPGQPRKFEFPPPPQLSLPPSVPAPAAAPSSPVTGATAGDAKASTLQPAASHGHGHGHSHGAAAGNADLVEPLLSQSRKEEHERRSCLSLLLFLVLSVHGFVEGLVLGLAHSLSGVLTITLAIALHKWVESALITVNLINAHAKRRRIYLIIVLFSFVTPLGIAAGLLSDHILDDTAQSLVNAFCVGSFVYVGASEVIVDSFTAPGKIKTKFFALLLGAGVLAATLIGHKHEHDHDHD